jgi:hypothetical protein
LAGRFAGFPSRPLVRLTRQRGNMNSNFGELIIRGEDKSR